MAITEHVVLGYSSYYVYINTFNQTIKILETLIRRRNVKTIIIIGGRDYSVGVATVGITILLNLLLCLNSSS
jgi:hypothetical protein